MGLRDEIDAQLLEVETSRGTCAGHPALPRAIGTLLRCQRAQLSQRAAGTAAGAKAGGLVGAVLVGLVEVARNLAGRRGEQTLAAVNDPWHNA